MHGFHGFIIIHVILYSARECGVHVPAFLFIIKFQGMVFGDYWDDGDPDGLFGNNFSRSFFPLLFVIFLRPIHLDDGMEEFS